MSDIISSIDIGKQICDVMGLDVKKTISINIKLEAGAPVIIETVQYMLEPERKGFVQVLSEFNLNRTDKTKEIISTIHDEIKPTFEK